ncbi:MAG: T9SS type A sorting domain-containing protein [Saprospiraceae bacterium]|nr:T9SS type A sorting domain-containing protein [Saprospiraceae bacterium]
MRQIDLSDPSTYSKGEVILVTDKYGWPFEFFYSMGARAPDGKIYFNSTNTSSTLNVIHHPNKKSSACEIKPHDFPILFNRTMVNFPNFNLGRMIGSACDTIGIVSVKEVQNHDTHEMMIYPNPSYDDINLELWNRDKNISEITIMDIQGKVIRHETNQKTTFKFKINISDLSSGLYLVKVKDQHGKTYSGKMVKN